MGGSGWFAIEFLMLSRRARKYSTSVSSASAALPSDNVAPSFSAGSDGMDEARALQVLPVPFLSLLRTHTRARRDSQPRYRVRARGLSPAACGTSRSRSTERCRVVLRGHWRRWVRLRGRPRTEGRHGFRRGWANRAIGRRRDAGTQGARVSREGSPCRSLPRVRRPRRGSTPDRRRPLRRVGGLRPPS